MEELITVRRNEAVCTSLEIAERFEKGHREVLRAIDNLTVQNCAVKNMFHEGKYKAENGHEYRMFYMNRDGFSLLAMGFTGKKAIEWKIKYINAFNEMEKVLVEKSTTLWLQTREQSKIGRKDETNAIQKFVEYAKENGSGKADMYYKHFSSLANKTVGITDRDLASVVQLNTLTLTERIIAIKILEGLKAQTEYHQLYKDIKEHLMVFNQVAYLT